jgi:hypothetical protein
VSWLPPFLAGFVCGSVFGVVLLALFVGGAIRATPDRPPPPPPPTPPDP